MNYLTIVSVPAGWVDTITEAEIDFCFNEKFIDAMLTWLKGYEDWVMDHPIALKERGLKDFIDQAGMPPNLEDYIFAGQRDEPRTCLQTYWTNLCGQIPVSPVFNNLADLKAWLELNSYPSTVITELLKTCKVQLMKRPDKEYTLAHFGPGKQKTALSR